MVNVTHACGVRSRRLTGKVTPPSVICWHACATAARNFSGWWEAHDVGTAGAGQKRLNHPKKGNLRFEYASFQANDDPALELVVFAPA